MKRILILLFLPFLGISQQLTTQNILYDGNNREYIIYVPKYLLLNLFTINFEHHYYLHFMEDQRYANDFMNYECCVI